MPKFKFSLYRFSSHRDGLLGVLVADPLEEGQGPRIVLACTLEIPLAGAFLPVGAHPCSRVALPKGRTTFCVEAPGSPAVSFREGNIKSRQAHGCVLLGKNWQSLCGEARGLMNTGMTFHAFMELMEGTEKFDLAVVDLSKPAAS